MFDNTQNTTLNVTPEAATSLPPVRVVLGNDVYWLRPSNVLRVEATGVRRRKAHVPEDCAQ